MNDETMQRLRAELVDIQLDHPIKAHGRNLGQYVYEYDCACGAKLTTDANNPERANIHYVQAQHISTFILQALAAEIERVLNNARSKEPFVCEYGHKVYGHTTADSWCCACEADQAFMKAEIERAEVEARLDELGVIMEMKPLTTVDSLLNLWGDRMSERKAELKSKTGGDNAKPNTTN